MTELAAQSSHFSNLLMSKAVKGHSCRGVTEMRGYEGVAALIF